MTTKMNRRSFVATLGMATASGCISYGRKEPETTEEVPEKVKETEPLANAFYEEITKYYENARVFINKDGEIALEYKTGKETVEELNSEMHGIANLYAEVAMEHEPTTLSIITGEVQAIVPEASVTAYTNGDIEKDAFLETIEVKGIERRD